MSERCFLRYSNTQIYASVTKKEKTREISPISSMMRPVSSELFAYPFQLRFLNINLRFFCCLLRSLRKYYHVTYAFSFLLFRSSCCLSHPRKLLFLIRGLKISYQADQCIYGCGGGPKLTLCTTSLSSLVWGRES